MYAFCLHERVPATNDNVRDPACWRFWVLATRQLDDELGTQENVGLKTLNRLTEPRGSVSWTELRAEVDWCVDI
ncbi:MAG: hypothetical protein OXE75_02860 [bacterium]|nr:hypothetical protein [bacterium]